MLPLFLLNSLAAAFLRAPASWRTPKREQAPALQNRTNEWLEISAQFGVFKLCRFSAVGWGVIIRRMSRLRRLVLSDRFFFITCRVYRPRGKLNEGEFSILAQVVRERRKKHRFLLTAWVLLPDHGHG